MGKQVKSSPEVRERAVLLEHRAHVPGARARGFSLLCRDAVGRDQDRLYNAVIENVGSSI